MVMFIFFFNDTATTEIYTLSLHDALPIFYRHAVTRALIADAMGETATARGYAQQALAAAAKDESPFRYHRRSEEHTSELQSRSDIVCRLLLEKKKIKLSILSQ